MKSMYYKQRKENERERRKGSSKKKLGLYTVYRWNTTAYLCLSMRAMCIQLFVFFFFVDYNLMSTKYVFYRFHLFCSSCSTCVYCRFFPLLRFLLCFNTWCRSSIRSPMIICFLSVFLLFITSLVPIRTNSKDATIINSSSKFSLLAIYLFFLKREVI